MIDFVINGVSAGAAAVGGLKLLSFIDKHSKNGNGFTQEEHDRLLLVKAGLDLLHTDLNEIKTILLKH